MNFEELLKNLGLGEETITKITEAMKENKLYLSGEENIDIRYGKLKTTHQSKLDELQKANELIESLKNSNQGNEELQSKVTEYEGQIATLQSQLESERLDNAVKVALLSENVVDVDYLTFKLKEKGELKLNDNGEIENWKDRLESLKTQFPTMFSKKEENIIDENKLPEGKEGADKTPLSLADAIKLQYEENKN